MPVRSRSRVSSCEQERAAVASGSRAARRARRRSRRRSRRRRARTAAGSAATAAPRARSGVRPASRDRSRASARRVAMRGEQLRAARGSARACRAGRRGRAGAPAQRDARGDALDVGAAGAERRAGVCDAASQRARRPHAWRARESGAVAQRMVQPVAQQPAAHAGGAGVEQREQRRRAARRDRLGDLEVAARRRVQRTNSPSRSTLHRA